MPPPFSTLTTPYTSAPAACNPYTPVAPSTLLMPPHPLHLPSSRFRITSIVYGGSLAYTINTIKEIC
ncbi:hypothetical protein O181_130303 [Austropuccinia psidii MF-1]|uniref:Uncharacterized protein n=1 Tax=Austropuccinia psidii MF-1 TaxID=1389203 RepID=A0A9Q3KZU5_9BASI|nr:hypothetical protein [Austropuccinia psidii MF-1]